MMPSDPKNTREALFQKLDDAAKKTLEYIELQKKIKTELEKIAPYQVYDLVEVRTAGGKKTVKIYGVSVRKNAYFFKVYLQLTNRNKGTYIAESDIIKAIKPSEPKPKKD